MSVFAGSVKLSASTLSPMSTLPNVESRPYIGHGVGLRTEHYDLALRGGIDVDWVEVISENHIRGDGRLSGGRPAAVLDALRREMPLVLHGVSLGIASAIPPRDEYLAAIARLAQRYEPAWVSDHLCWTRMAHSNGRSLQSHDLLPFCYDDATLDFVASRVNRVQDRWRRVLVLENPSTYVGFRSAEMGEAEFLEALCKRTGCRLLLDLNNIEVNAKNHGIDVDAYLSTLSPEHVWQFHLANHSDRASYKFDDHRGPVPECVWANYRKALLRFGCVSSLVEWDSEVPQWSVLANEQATAVRIAREIIGSSPAVSVPAPVFESSRAQCDAPLPSKLERVQQLLARAITWPTGTAGFLESCSREDRELFASEFTASADFSGRARIDVYAEAYFWRIYEVLRTHFPVVEWSVGPTTFRNICTDYLLARPSENENLGLVGRALPDFLESHAHARVRPWIVDYARVESQLVDAVDACDSPTVTEGDLRALDASAWPQISFELTPTTRRVITRWDYGEAVRAKMNGTAELEPIEAPGTTLIWRQQMAARQRRLDTDEAVALAAVAEGVDFSEICRRVHVSTSQPREQTPARVVAWLRAWIATHLLASIRGPETLPQA